MLLSRRRGLCSARTATSQGWGRWWCRPWRHNPPGLGRPPTCACLVPAGEPPGTELGLGAGHLVLVAVAVSALVAGTAALFVTRYRRMAGKYSFNTQSNNFSYQVFHE